MPHITDSKLRLESILDVLDQALAGEFPYAEPSKALNALRQCVDYNLQDLQDPHKDEDEENVVCERADQVAKDISTFIGFLIRSTNVRNSFEWVWPFQELCDQLFSSNFRKVILSSEWNFVPFITTVAPYSNILGLSEFVFIGLPATESKNPLIIPAAAHEVGHAFWREIIDNQMKSKIDNLVHEEKNRIISESSDMNINFDRASSDVNHQIQEMFCDFIGLGLFGMGYLHTFHYFCPTVGKRIDNKLVRTPDYPSNQCRAEQMIKFYKSVNCVPPERYIDRYDDPKLSGFYEFEDHIQFVDSLAAKLFQDVMELAVSHLKNRNLLRGDRSGKVALIVDAFCDNRPYFAPDSIADIVEAGWNVHLENNQFSGRFSDLSNLVLKTIEIYEFKKRGQS